MSRRWKLGVLGGPSVGRYSLSPLMHRVALEAAGLEGVYEPHPASPERLGAWLEETGAVLDGFSVTMPHKEAVFEWVRRQGRFGQAGTVQTPEWVRAIGAVNTVKMEAGRPVGYNTDGPGFLRALDLKQDCEGKSVFLLGAGGAAQAIALALVGAGRVGRLTVWNRSFERAERLGEQLRPLHAGRGDEVQAVRLPEDVPIETVDLLVNATPLGMEAEPPVVDVDRLRTEAVVCDIVYTPPETPLLRAARGRVRKAVGGSEMLAAQGAEAFRIWTGRDRALDGRPIFSVMKQALDDHFASGR